MNADKYARDESRVREVFGALADLVYSAGEYQETYRAVCAAAPSLVSGCDHASLAIRQGNRLFTAAESDGIARQIDAFEREVGEGPCVDAINEDTPQIDADLRHARLWVGLSNRIVQATPVRGVAGFRVLVDERKVGALNFFSDTPGALTEKSVNEASVLTAFTSVALIAMSYQEAATTLREGLDSNREIGKAIGLLMAFHKVTDDDAFAMLQRTSQDLNIKMAEVAREVLEHQRTREP